MSLLLGEGGMARPPRPKFGVGKARSGFRFGARLAKQQTNIGKGFRIPTRSYKFGFFNLKNANANQKFKLASNAPKPFGPSTFA